MHRSIHSLPRSALRALSAALALQLGLFAPMSVAVAQTSADKAASRKVFLAAQEDYAAGRYADALSKYQEAHRLFPMPAFIFNMAQCQRLLEQPEEALALYRRYLEEEPKARNRKTVEGFISELEPAVAALQKQKALAQLTPAPQPETALPPAAVAELSKPAPAAAPLHQQWWFWTGLAVVAGGVATGVVVANSGGSAGPPASLGDVVLR